MLPKNLKYGSKIESSISQNIRTNIAPQNNGTGPYGLGQTIIINIPTQNNLVLATTESYLKFDLTIENDAADNKILWDSSAHGIIQRIRVFHASNLIQDIDNYSLLAKMLFDLQVSTDACYGRFNELVGTRNDLNVTTIAAAAGAANPAANLSCKQINSGEYYEIAANASQTRTFCLNLISVLGTLCPNQYFPLFSCTAASLRIEIQLVSQINQALASNEDIASIALNNVEYIAQFIKLSDNAMSMIYSSLGGQPLEFSVPDYSNYQYSYSTIPLNTPTQINFAIPARYSSLKSLFVMMRRERINTDHYFPLSCISGNIKSYYVRVGSSILPTRAPESLPEMFAEVLKAMGSMSDLNYHPSIEKESYELVRSVEITAAGFKTVNSGSFYIGLDLENYVGASKDTIFAGYNSNTDDIFCVLNLTPAAALTPRFDAFANFDSVLVFENGVCYRKF
eukprot:gene17941-25105_t